MRFSYDFLKAQMFKLLWGEDRKARVKTSGCRMKTRILEIFKRVVEMESLQTFIASSSNSITIGSSVA